MEDFDSFRKIVANTLKIDGEELTLETRFREDLGIDSLDMVGLIGVLEKRYQIRVPEDDLSIFRTLGDAYNFIVLSYTKL